MEELVGEIAIAVTRPLTGSTRPSVWPFGMGKGPSAVHAGPTGAAPRKAGRFVERSFARGRFFVGGIFSMNLRAGISENPSFSFGGAGRSGPSARAEPSESINTPVAASSAKRRAERGKAGRTGSMPKVTFMFGGGAGAADDRRDCVSSKRFFGSSSKI